MQEDNTITMLLFVILLVFIAIMCINIIKQFIEVLFSGNVIVATLAGATVAFIFAGWACLYDAIKSTRS